jgi:hypothetical protein
MDKGALRTRHEALLAELAGIRDIYRTDAGPFIVQDALPGSDKTDDAAGRSSRGS